MTKRTIVFWLSIGVIIVPFLGVPIQWKEYTLIALGVLSAILSAPIRRKRVLSQGEAVYVENRPAVEKKD